MAKKQAAPGAQHHTSGWLRDPKLFWKVPRSIKLGWRPIYCSGYDEFCPIQYDARAQKFILDANGKLQPVRDAKGEVVVDKLYHHLSADLDWTVVRHWFLCTCKPGVHYQVVHSTAFEVAQYGGRGSGKSEDAMGIIMRGNPGWRETGEAADVSYINNPNYRYLVLRRNAKDLDDFWRRIKKFFLDVDSRTTFTEEPKKIKHPSGAEGVLDHMDGPDAYMKYQGQEFQTIVFEEVGQCPREDDYEKIRMSCRSTDPKLTPKIYLTYNPGGPGTGWLKARFHRAPMWDKKNKTLLGIAPVPSGALIHSGGGQYRVSFKSTIFDNPYFLRGNQEYLKSLQNIKDPILRKQWLEGDMDAFEGQYFPEFRERPHAGEPENACHVYDPAKVQMQPWWPRWISLDWGFRHSSVAYFMCQSPDGRIWVYREMERRTSNPDDLGESLALAAHEDIQAQPGMTIPVFISPEIWPGQGVDTAVSLVGQIAAGVNRILGPESVFVERSDEGLAYGKCHMVFRQAFNKRVEGWTYVRSLMRWQLLPSEQQQEFDLGVALGLQREGKTTEYQAYMDRFTRRGPPPVLPRLQISRECKILIEAIPQAQFVGTESNAAKKGYAAEDLLKQSTLADDALDSLRYGLTAYKFRMNEEPFHEFLGNRLNRIAPDNETGRRFATMKAEDDWEKRNSNSPLFLPRRGSRRGAEMDPVEKFRDPIWAFAAEKTN